MAFMDKAKSLFKKSAGGAPGAAAKHVPVAEVEGLLQSGTPDDVIRETLTREGYGGDEITKAVDGAKIKLNTTGLPEDAKPPWEDVKKEEEVIPESAVEDADFMAGMPEDASIEKLSLTSPGEENKGLPDDQKESKVSTGAPSKPQQKDDAQDLAQPDQPASTAVPLEPPSAQALPSTPGSTQDDFADFEDKPKDEGLGDPSAEGLPAPNNSAPQKQEFAEKEPAALSGPAPATKAGKHKKTKFAFPHLHKEAPEVPIPVPKRDEAPPFAPQPSFPGPAPSAKPEPPGGHIESPAADHMAFADEVQVTPLPTLGDIESLVMPLLEEFRGEMNEKVQGLQGELESLNETELRLRAVLDSLEEIKGRYSSIADQTQDFGRYEEEIEELKASVDSVLKILKSTLPPVIKTLKEIKVEHEAQKAVEEKKKEISHLI